MGPVKVEVVGDVNSVQTGSGDVIISGNCTTFSSMSGSIKCDTVGSVESMSGSITANVIKGMVSTKSGKIYIR